MPASVSQSDACPTGDQSQVQSLPGQMSFAYTQTFFAYNIFTLNIRDNLHEMSKPVFC